MRRTLRSKRLRYLLWQAADGKCQLCGCELDPDNWHADHIIPWSKTGRTNVHEMQALCPACNLKKGSKVQLRSHQKQLVECMESGDGSVERIIAYVTPGGGKSLLPQILATKLIPRTVDKICWIVPRVALQEQGARTFQDPWCRDILGHRLQIRESTNDFDPARGNAGYITTYNAISQAGPSQYNTHTAEFDRHRYALVLDEPHHVRLDSTWHKALSPLVDRCRVLLLMTGSLQRREGQRIAFIPYRDTQSSIQPFLEDTDDTRIIQYPRRLALNDRAIIPALFHKIDGAASYIDRAGTTQTVPSIAEAEDNPGDVLFTALRTAYAEQLLTRCFEHWRNHRSRVNPRSKMLVVCATIGQAKRLMNQLDSTEAGIATSDDTASALQEIRQFKAGHRSVLFTVAMAYEGLDVPSITHIACLTLFRHRPWIEQMFARATRFDYGATHCPQQFAYLFVPDDVVLNAVIEDIEDEQQPFVRSLENEIDDENEVIECGVDTGSNMNSNWVVPLSGEATRERSSELDGDSLDYAETQHIQEAMERHGVVGVSPLQIKQVIVECGVVEMKSSDAIASDAVPLTTPRQREKNLKSSIESHVRRAAFENDVEPKDISKEIVRRWHKRRPDMTEDELTEVWKWLQIEYPIEMIDA